MAFPTGRIELNPNSPLTSGLFEVWRVMSGKFLHRMIRGDFVTVDATNDIVVTNQVGHAIDFNADGFNDNSTPQPTAYPLTLACWMQATTKDEYYFRLGGSGTFSAFGITTFYAESRLAIQTRNDSTDQFLDSGIDAGGKYFSVVGVWVSATERYLYVDGVQKVSSTSSISFPSGLNRWAFGQEARLSSKLATGQASHFMAWDRALSAPEVYSLWDPGSRWSIYRQPTRVWPVFVAAGGSHALTATAITTGQPTVGTPALGQVHSLTATAITTGQPTVGTPTASESNQLTATAITTGQPTVGSPDIAQAHSLTATAITTGQPTVDAPAVGQVHSLTATSITTGQPTVGTPTASTSATDSLTATDITAAAPTVATSTISQVHSLTAAGIVASAPSAATPALGQVHVLVMLAVVAGAPELGSPLLDLTIDPARTATVAQEIRTATIASELRRLAVALENRTKEA